MRIAGLTATIGRKRLSNPWAQQILLHLLVIAYTFSLLIVYKIYITPAFGYMGYLWAGWHPIQLTVSMMLIVIVAAFLPKSLSSASDIVIWILFVMVYVPTEVVPLTSGGVAPSEALNLSLATAICFAIVLLLTQRAPRQRAWYKPLPRRSFFFYLVAAALVLNAYILLLTGFHYKVPGFDEVYDIRRHFRTVVAESPLLLGYVISWMIKVVNPILIIGGLQYKRVFPVVLGTLGLLSIYTLNGQKSALFTILLIIVVYALWTFLKIKTLGPRTLMLLFVLLVNGSYAVGVVVHSVVPVSLLVRRLLVTPGQLAGIYFDYYSNHPWTYFQQSWLLNFTGTHVTKPAEIIGQYMSGRSDVSANASLFSEGFAALGYVGMFAMAVLLAFLLRALNAVSKDLPNVTKMALLITPTVTLMSAALTTSLLTHGLVALMILLWLYPREAPFMGGDLAPRSHIDLPGARSFNHNRHGRDNA